MKVYNAQIFPILPLIMNANLTSQAYQLTEAWSYSIQIVFTGTPTGTFKLQGSSDNIIVGIPSLIATQSPIHWTDLVNSSESVSAAGSLIWDVPNPGYNYVRVIYTDGSSGVSTAVITSARINAKSI